MNLNRGQAASLVNLTSLRHDNLDLGFTTPEQ
jgi:hypothetical protein